MNPSPEIVPSHIVIDTHIKGYGKDYRFEVAPNPIEQLRDRRCDNTKVGRTWTCDVYRKKESDEESNG